MEKYKITRQEYIDYTSFSPVPGEKLKNFYSNSVQYVEVLDVDKARKLYDICTKICKLLDENKIQYRIAPLPAGVSFHYINENFINSPYIAKSRKYTLNSMPEHFYTFPNGIFLYKVVIDESCKIDTFTVGNDEFILRAGTVMKPNLIDEFPQFEFI